VAVPERQARASLTRALLAAAGLACLASVAFSPARAADLESVEIGRSSEGRRISALELAGRDPRSGAILVVGCIHGNECAGARVTRLVSALRRHARSDVWLVHDLNPDGSARRTRQNARGVDLNRNFPAGWRAAGEPWDPFYPGARPLSEPETRAIASLIRRVRPRTTIWFHQPQAVVRAWGRSTAAGRRYARLAREPFRRLRWPPGSASNWQNRRFAAGTSFVVELPPGPLSRAAARRHATAILALAG
jgi:murein peptide amidase A